MRSFLFLLVVLVLALDLRWPYFMRAILRGILLVIIFGFLRANASAAPICGNSRLTSALQYIQWHETNLGYNQMARTMALDESMTVQSSAKTMALLSSLVFLLSISVLAAAVTFRMIGSQTIALSLGGIYFLFFAFVLSSSREPIFHLTDTFRLEANSAKFGDLPSDVKSPEHLREFITLLGREQARVPEIFNEISSYLPAESRWWTMGWDEVSLINFQNEGYRALIRKGTYGLKAISLIRENLEKRCRESGTEI